MTTDTTTTMNWKNLYHGDCPRCVAQLKQTDDTVHCTAYCGFKMDAFKYFARCKRSTPGYWRVKHRSQTEEEALRDICFLQ